MPTSIVFLNGVAATACATAAFFFVRYWFDTRDRFFLFFAAALGIMAVNWTITVAIRWPDDSRQYVYLLRLFAFVLIAIGVIDKNRTNRRGG